MLPLDRLNGPAVAATVLLTVVVLLPTGTASSQQVALGRVDEIVDLELPNAPEVTEPTAKVQTQVRGGGTWTDLERDATLWLEQRLRVSRLLNVRVKVDYRSGAGQEGGARRHHGELVFLTDLLFTEDGGIPTTRVFRASRVEEAVYDVSAPGTGGPTVAVEQGSLVARWRGGDLTVQIAGRRILVEGTDVAFHAYAGGDSALVYLREGTITFLDAPGVVAADGQLYLVTSNGAPVNLTDQLQPEQALGWVEATEFNGRDVWAQGSFFGRLPWYGWVGGAVAVAAGSWCVASECWQGGEGGGPRSGIVILRLPF